MDNIDIILIKLLRMICRGIYSFNFTIIRVLLKECLSHSKHIKKFITFLSLNKIGWVRYICPNIGYLMCLDGSINHVLS